MAIITNLINLVDTSITVATQAVNSVGHISNIVHTTTGTLDSAATIYAESINVQLKVISNENKQALALMNLD